ncbi:MAG: copper resistance protein CopC [Euzebyales bacterium]|jgi:methionine-rich copper-binding protein CopC|nr:copper resistance protein CopC [Euzebyales bacterium]
MPRAPAMLRVPAVAAAALLALAALAVPAAAHARLLSSDPAGGATLDQPPERVTLTFSEQIEADFAQLQVTGPGDQRLDAGAPEVDGDVVRGDLEPFTQTGTYTVAFRVISADGHPVESTFDFDVSDVPAAAADPSPTLTQPDEPTATPSAEPEPTATAPTAPPTPTASPTSGEVDAAPAASPSPSEVDAAPATASGEGEGGSGLAGLLLAVAGVGAVIAAVFLAVRRGSRGQPDAQAGD